MSLRWITATALVATSLAMVTAAEADVPAPPTDVTTCTDACPVNLGYPHEFGNWAAETSGAPANAAYDDDGDLATGDLVIMPYEQAKTVPLAGPDADGALFTAYDTVTVGANRAAQAYPVSHCTPYGPSTSALYDKGRNKYYYKGEVGVGCGNTVKVHCVAELWRVSDMDYWQDIDPDSGLRTGNCFGQALSPFYKERRKHYTKGALRMVTTVGIWLKDPGAQESEFKGWRCNGFNSNTLDCVKTGSTES